MRKHKRFAVATALAAGCIALAGPAAAQANEVTHWNRIAMNTLVAFPGPAGGAPPALQINMGMTQGAVYDALNAIEPKHHRPYLLHRRFGATASKGAATATASYRVLSSIVAGVPQGIPFPNRAALQAGLDAEYAASLAGIPVSPFKRMGIRAGNAAAEAMIAARAGDGRFGPSQWVPLVGPGYWQPLLNPDGTPQLDPTPWVGGVRPFLLETSSQFRTPGPNPLGSAAYAADFKEVKSLGRVDSVDRDATQMHNALFWQSSGGPALLWGDVASDFVETPSYRIGMADSARLLAMMNLAGADAAINCWNDKYHYDFWRPWHAIQQADTDGNPATDPDPTWTSLLTAPYPEHPSGHLCLDGAELSVLQSWFGDNVAFGVTSSRFGGETRLFDHFSDVLAEITEARIWAGLHFRTADVQAKVLGRNVTNYMEAHYFQPVGNH
jgi:hypothetical protein